MRTAFFLFLFLFHGIVCFSQEKIILTVYFRFDKYDVDFIYKNKIDSAMQNYNFGEVSIAAHCDSIGSNNYNDALSLKRAIEVKQYLVSKKLNESIIKIKALGKRFPLNKNENAKARALNRRAELLFIAEDSLQVNQTDTLQKNSYVQVPSIPDSNTLSGDTSILAISTVEVGKTFVLENLNFYGGRHVLLPKSHKTLERLLKTLKANPTLEIEIQGHICCLSSGDGMDIDTRTMNLSVNRAKAIYDYLVKNRIDPSRLSYRGFGSSRKLILEFTEEDRTTNRRVEIKVLKK